MSLSATKQKIVSNLMWSVAGKVVNMLGGLLVGIIVARNLGDVQYGELNYVIGFVALFQPFAMFGLDSIEVREEARGKMPYQTIIGTAFGLRVALAIICCMVLIGCSFCIETDSRIIMLVCIYSISVLLNSFNVIRNHFLALVRNEYVVKSEMNRTLWGMLIKAGLLYLDASLPWFVIAYTFDVLLLASGYIYAYKHEIGSILEWHFDREYAKYLLRESFPLVLTYAAVIIYQNIDQVMIGNMIDKRSVAYFAIAAKFVEVMLYVSTMLVQTITPILVSARDRSVDEYRAKGQQFINITFWLALILAVMMALMSETIVSLTYGSQYIAAVAVLQILAFKAASFALSSTAGAMIIIEHRQRYAVFRDILGCICYLGLTMYLLPKYGIVAAAVIAITSNLVAGYLSGLLIPAYRHIFVMQTRAVFFGWQDVMRIRQILRK